MIEDGREVFRKMSEVEEVKKAIDDVTEMSKDFNDVEIMCNHVHGEVNREGYTHAGILVKFPKKGHSKLIKQLEEYGCRLRHEKPNYGRNHPQNYEGYSMVTKGEYTVKLNQPVIF